MAFVLENAKRRRLVGQQVAVVADNPPEKKLDGIRDERGRGHGINVMSDSALGPRPPPRSKVDKTQGVRARRSPRQHWTGGQGARVAVTAAS